MLVLTRRLGECICIGQHIEIVPIRRRGEQITLGIEAPSDVVIFRKETQAAEDIKEKRFGQEPSSAAHTLPSTYNLSDREYAILRFRDFQHKLNYSRRTLDRRIADRLWTKPIRLSGNTVGWPVIEVEMLITAYIAGQSDYVIAQLVKMLEAARQKLIEG